MFERSILHEAHRGFLFLLTLRFLPENFGAEGFWDAVMCDETPDVLDGDAEFATLRGIQLYGEVQVRRKFLGDKMNAPKFNIFFSHFLHGLFPVRSLVCAHQLRDRVLYPYPSAVNSRSRFGGCINIFTDKIYCPVQARRQNGP